VNDDPGLRDDAPPSGFASTMGDHPAVRGACCRSDRRRLGRRQLRHPLRARPGSV